MGHRFLCHSALAIALVSFLAGTATVSKSAQSSTDSKEVSALLSELKVEAVNLKLDAGDLKSFANSKLSLDSHSVKIMEMREHVNASGKLLQKLADSSSKASPWQRKAIDQITPLMIELTATVGATIEQLNQHPKLLHTGPYAEYAAASHEHAASLSELISDYVSYGEAKAKSEELASKLNVSSL